MENLTKGFQKQRLSAAKRIIKTNISKSLIYFKQFINDDNSAILCNGFVWVKLNTFIEGLENCSDKEKQRWSLTEDEAKHIISQDNCFGDKCVYKPYELLTLSEYKKIRNDDFHKWLKSNRLFVNQDGKSMAVYKFDKHTPLFDIDNLITLMELLCSNNKTKIECMIPETPLKPIVLKTEYGWGMICSVREKEFEKYYRQMENFYNNSK